MQAHGIRVALAEGVVGRLVCLLTHVKTGILVFCCHFWGSIFSAWEHYKHEIFSY